MNKIEGIMGCLGSIGFFGLGLWFGSVYHEEYTTLIGVSLVFLVALAATILYIFMRKKTIL